MAALEKVPATVPVDDLLVAEREMVELGRTHGPLDLRKAGVQVRNRLDTDGPEPKEQKAYDRESLKLKGAENGVAFTGYLANENAELFRALIHAHAKPRKTIDGALDPRSRDKRQADALTTLLTTANNPTATATATASPAAGPAGSAGPVGAGSPDPGAAADDLAGTLPGMCADTDPAAAAPRARRLPRPPGRRPSPPAAPSVRRPGPAAARPVPDGPAGSFPGMARRRTSPSPSTSTTSKPPPPTNSATSSTATPCPRPPSDASPAMRRSCPIVLGSDSQPLDVGTTIRLATGPIRNALITRDKGCVCCGAPPIYCDAHHVVHWIDGGATKLTNLALLCKRCHRDLHAGHWTIRITDGVVHVTRPTWATPDPVPRGRYRPPTTTADPSPTTRGTAGPWATVRGARTTAAGPRAPGRVTPIHPGSPPRTPLGSTPGATHLTNGPAARQKRPTRRLTSTPGATPPTNSPAVPSRVHPPPTSTPGATRLTSGPAAARRSHPAVTSTPGATPPTNSPPVPSRVHPPPTSTPGATPPTSDPAAAQKVPPGGDFDPWGDRFR